MIGICPHLVLGIFKTQWYLCHPYVNKYNKYKPSIDHLYRTDNWNYITGNSGLDNKYMIIIDKFIWGCIMWMLKSAHFQKICNWIFWVPYVEEQKHS